MAIDNQVAQTNETNDTQAGDRLGTMLWGMWFSWSEARKRQEDQWLKNIRQFKKRYEATILNNIKENRSHSYLGITTKKVFEAYAFEIDSFFPGSGIKHWSIDPTPVPESMRMPEPQQQQEAAALLEAIKTDTKNMSRLIADQLVEANYPNLFRSAVFDSTVLGTGILVSGEMNIVNGQKILPRIRYLSPFDCYPDPEAPDVESMSGVFERMVVNRRKFVGFGNKGGFDRERIEEIVLQNPKGNHSKLHWEDDLDDIYNKNSIISDTIRYEILRFEGYLNGLELSQVGIPIPQEALVTEFRVEAWISSNKTIFIDIKPDSDEPFYKYRIFPHQKEANKIWGMGVPEMMSDSQDLLNAGIRRQQDDLANAGVIFEVSERDITAGSKKTINDIYNGKIIFKEPGDLAYPAVRATKIPTISAELGAFIEMIRKFIDDETNMPSSGSGFAPTGTSSAQRTASGLSILKGQSDVIRNTPIKHIDDYLVVPMIKSLYQFNLKWFGENFIGGLDVKVKALGLKSLIAKEVQIPQLQNLLNNSNNALDAKIVKRENTYKSMVESVGLNPDETVRTEEEVAQLPQDPVQQELDSLSIEKAKLENDEIEARIKEIEAKTVKEFSAVDHDEELLRQSGIKLKTDILANARNNGKDEKKATSATVSKKKIRRDNLVTNN